MLRFERISNIIQRILYNTQKKKNGKNKHDENLFRKKKYGKKTDEKFDNEQQMTKTCRKRENINNSNIFRILKNAVVAWWSRHKLRNTVA